MAALSTDENLSERIFEHTWAIGNWESVYKIESLIENTKTEIECQVENVVYAKFMLGLKVVPENNYRYVRFYWKLLHKHFCLDSMQADLVIESVKRDGSLHRKYQIETNAEIGKVIDINDRYWALGQLYDFAPYTNLGGSLLQKIKVTLKNLPDVLGHSKQQEFGLACKSEFSRNMAALVNNKANSDLKIITKEKTELFTHKAILCAQCPVFSSMFGSDFLEGSSNEVTITDISAISMKLLLHFWYTGELLPAWKDDDVVVEFTYAAGKYQMTQVLEMLDHLLRRDLKTSHLDVELLRLVSQLSLKKAEARILKLVIYKMNQAKNGVELLDVVSLTDANFNEKIFTFSEVLKAFDDVLSENTVTKACSRDVTLMALACKNGVKNLEIKLLNRIIDTVNTITSADKLFALFDIQNGNDNDESADRNLLVRAK